MVRWVQVWRCQLSACSCWLLAPSYTCLPGAYTAGISGGTVNRSKFAIVISAAICLGLFGPATSLGQQTSVQQTPAAQIVDELGTLASDAMRGRGSGTADELKAAKYLADELQQIG